MQRLCTQLGDRLRTGLGHENKTCSVLQCVNKKLGQLGHSCEEADQAVPEVQKKSGSSMVGREDNASGVQLIGGCMPRPLPEHVMVQAAFPMS